MAVALADLSSLPMLLKAQETAGVQRAECVASMFTAWAARCHALPQLSAVDKTRLTLAIDDAPFSREQRAELAKLVMMGGSTEQRGAQHEDAIVRSLRELHLAV